MPNDEFLQELMSMALCASKNRVFLPGNAFDRQLTLDALRADRPGFPAGPDDALNALSFVLSTLSAQPSSVASGPEIEIEHPLKGTW